MRNIIAIMGKPKAGKTEVARILHERHGAVIVDDGMILRLAAPFLFNGVDLPDTLTQVGKDKIVTVNGKDYQVRGLLGYLGQVLEDFFGADFIPDQTMRRIATMAPARFYVLPSVRKTQGHFYRAAGALVLEIDRDVPESPYAFDQYDATAAHETLDNNGSIPDLENRVLSVLRDTWGKLPRSGLPPVDVRELVKSL